MNSVVEKAAPACRLIRSEIVLRRACPVCRASDKDSATETAVSDCSLTVGEGREKESLDKRRDDRSNSWREAEERPRRSWRESGEK